MPASFDYRAHQPQSRLSVYPDLSCFLQVWWILFPPRTVDFDLDLDRGRLIYGDPNYLYLLT
jgi:hypothetical protein